MTLQLEIEGIAPPSIATRKGRMKLSSLRPGDWLRNNSGVYVCILVNSSKLRRAVVFFPALNDEISVSHEEIAGHRDFYIGHGTKRLWRAWLPKFLQKRICPYSKP